VGVAVGRVVGLDVVGAFATVKLGLDSSNSKVSRTRILARCTLYSPGESGHSLPQLPSYGKSESNVTDPVVLVTLGGMV
jgi:hypothetical protein